MKGGDETYFNNIRSDQFFSLIFKEDLQGVVSQSGVSY